MPLFYRGWDIITRLRETVLVIKAEMPGKDLDKILGGDYGALILVDEYSARLLSCDKLRAPSPLRAMEIGKYRGFVKKRNPGESVKMEFDIPINSELINAINDIRREEKIVGLEVYYDAWITPLTYSPQFRRDHGRIYMVLSTGELQGIITFPTEEIDDFMHRVKYVGYVRLEVPILLPPKPPHEILAKSAEGLKEVERALIKGDYPQVMIFCRNIIMNWLLPRKREGERALNEELCKYILSKIPEDVKETYKMILNALEETLRRNLDHVHKFVKEVAGRPKLIRMPLKEDAEFVYSMLVSIVRYLSELVFTWRER